MAVEGHDVTTVDKRLTKGNEPLPKAAKNELPTYDLSTIIMEAREFKTKAYAAKDTIKVFLQYVDTINQLNGKCAQVVDDFQAKLVSIVRLSLYRDNVPT